MLCYIISVTLSLSLSLSPQGKCFSASGKMRECAAICFWYVKHFFDSTSQSQNVYVQTQLSTWGVYPNFWWLLP